MAAATLETTLAERVRVMRDALEATTTDYLACTLAREDVVTISTYVGALRNQECFRGAATDGERDWALGLGWDSVVRLLLTSTETATANASDTLMDPTDGPRSVRKLVVIVAYLSTWLMLPVNGKVRFPFPAPPCTHPLTMSERIWAGPLQTTLAVPPATVIGQLLEHLDTISAPLQLAYIEQPLVTMVRRFGRAVGDTRRAPESHDLGLSSQSSHLDFCLHLPPPPPLSF